MRPAIRLVALVVSVFTLASALGSNPVGSVMAQEGSKPAKSARGGALATVGAYQFEVFFYATGLRVFPWDSVGASIDASKLTGTATFYHPNSPQPWFERKLAPSLASPGQVSESLDLAMNLSTVPPTGARVGFEIAGLPKPGEPTARFTVPFEFVKTPGESPAVDLTPFQVGVTPSPGSIYGPGYHGFGYGSYPDPQTAQPRRSGPAISLHGYGQVPSASPSSPVPYLSGGHAVSILPSVGSSNPTAAQGSAPISRQPGTGDSNPAWTHGYASIASQAHYFPVAGYYNTAAGVVWVPAPGYYHVLAPTYYYPPSAYHPPANWRLAHPAPSPNSPVVRYTRRDLSGIHTDYYWHSRAMDDRASHEAWIRGQLREKYGPGSGP